MIADRTGGMRPGIFKKAVEKINKLQPEFVVSVGDLIDGYTTDQDIINNQWDEFSEIHAELQFKNDVNKPLYVSGVLESKDNIFFSPESIKCTVDSFSVFNQTIAVKTAINTKISQLEPLKITLTGLYKLSSGKKITLEKSSELLFDWYHICEMTQKEIVIDAQLDEWEQEKFLNRRNHY